MKEPLVPSLQQIGREKKCESLSFKWWLELYIEPPDHLTSQTPQFLECS